MPTQNYRVQSGKRVKGVTTILNVLAKPALIFWGYQQGIENYNKITEAIYLASEGPYDLSGESGDPKQCIQQIRDIIKHFQVGGLYDKRDKAADAGTLAHAFIEHDLKGKPEPNLAGIPRDIKRKAEGCYLSFLELKKRTNLKMKHSEISLISEKYGYGGTIDVVDDQAGLSIGDFKTGKDIYFTTWIQLSAYGNLYTENYPGSHLEGYHAYRFGPDGDFDHKFKFFLEDEWEIFLACLKIQDILDKKGQRL